MDAIKKRLERLSLSERVKLTFVASFSLLAILAMLVIFAIAKTLEDHIFENHLKVEIEEYLLDIRDHVAPRLPINITLYKHFDELPPIYQQAVNGKAPGIYELDISMNEEYHYGITNMANGDTYYFFYDAENLEVSEDIEELVRNAIIICFLIFFILLMVIFRTVLSRSLAPMFTLIKLLKASDGKPIKSLPRHQNDNEIGLLYRTLDEYGQRLDRFITREQEFTGFASHELRTPVTVIKGATELLELQQDKTPAIKRSIKRIKRATQSMENMIAVLLTLARENGKESTEHCDANQVLNETLENFIGQLAANDKKASFSNELTKSLTLPKVQLELVAANLIRNAIQHSDNELILIRLTNHSLCVINELDDSQDHMANRGYGLGKIIVERICHQQGWQFNYLEQNNQVIASVNFVST